MLNVWYSLNLQWKSTLTLGLGLALLFGLFGLIAARTLNQSTDAALKTRLSFAVMTAAGVDDLLRQARHGLEASAAMLDMREGDLQQQSLTLQQLLHVLASYDTLRLLDARGRVVWQGSAEEDGPPPVQPDLSWREDVAQVLATEETVVAQIAPSLSHHPLIAVVSTPVFAPMGKLRNIIQGDLHLSHMGSETAPLPKLGKSSYSAIVDSKGKVLASSEGNVDALSPEIEEHLELMASFISRDAPGVVIHHEESGDHVVAFAPLSTLGGGVIVEELEDEVLAIPQQLRGMLTVFGSSALLLASLGAWIYIRRIVQPLNALTAATATIAEGRLNSPISIDRRDEVGKLGQSFESMRRQLLAAREESESWRRGSGCAPPRSRS